jgi:phytoene dehydrogenase-like protein
MNTSLNTIVIGSDLSSLTAALISAYHGKSTALIIERDPPVSVSEKGYVFDTRNMYCDGIQPGGVLLRLLKMLGLSLPENTRIPPPLQVVFPDHRITHYDDPELLTKEMEREFGVSPKVIKNLYIKVLREIENVLSSEPTGETLLGTKKPFQPLLLNLRKIIWRKITFPFNFHELKKYPPLTDTFRGFASVLANVDADKLDPLSLSYALFILSKGIFLNHDEYHRLIEQLRVKFESLGGHIVKDCDIQKVSIGKPVSVEVKIGEEVFIIDGESIIASAKWEKLSTTLADDKRLSSLLRKYRKRESSFLYPFTFFLGVRERGLPEMMSETVIVMSDESQHFLKENLLIITRSPRSDTSYAPEESCSVSVTMFLEDPPRKLNDSVLRHLIQNSLETLGDFLPFLSENIDFLADEESINFSRTYQDVVNRKIHVKKGPSSEISILSNRRKLRNIAITGGELLPAFGIEGEVISGIEAAKRVIEKMER